MCRLGHDIWTVVVFVKVVVVVVVVGRCDRWRHGDAELSETFARVVLHERLLEILELGVRDGWRHVGQRVEAHLTAAAGLHELRLVAFVGAREHLHADARTSRWGRLASCWHVLVLVLRSRRRGKRGHRVHVRRRRRRRQQRICRWWYWCRRRAIGDQKHLLGYSATTLLVLLAVAAAFVALCGRVLALVDVYRHFVVVFIVFVACSSNDDGLFVSTMRLLCDDFEKKKKKKEALLCQCVAASNKRRL